MLYGPVYAQKYSMLCVPLNGIQLLKGSRVALFYILRPGLEVFWDGMLRFMVSQNQLSSLRFDAGISARGKLACCSCPGSLGVYKASAQECEGWLEPARRDNRTVFILCQYVKDDRLCSVNQSTMFIDVCSAGGGTCRHGKS